MLQYTFKIKSLKLTLYVENEVFPLKTRKMKQLDVVVSPPAFVRNPYLTLTHVTFDLDPCDL